MSKDNLKFGFIGFGPRSILVLERLLANAPEFLPNQCIEVHIFDPYAGVGGRVWRKEQVDLVWMNSRAEDVTFYTDDTCAIAGPIRPGPTLIEWLRLQENNGSMLENLKTEAKYATKDSFISRALFNYYLLEFFENIKTAAKDFATIIIHTHNVINIINRNENFKRDTLIVTTGARQAVDIVLLAQGHLDSAPTEKEASLFKLAQANDLNYFPSGHTIDIDYSEIKAKENVLVAGFGLAFIDLYILLTLGRGGKFIEEGKKLKYIPSGCEPTIFVGSNRGVPYRSKIGFTGPAVEPNVPKYFTADEIRKVTNNYPATNFETQIWPLIAKDLAYAHYWEVFNTQTHITNIDWAEFETEFDSFDWYSQQMRELEARAINNNEFVIDFEKLDQPLSELSPIEFDEFQHILRNHIGDDIERRHDEKFSCDAAVFSALLKVLGNVAIVAQTGLIPARMLIESFADDFYSFFSYLASGPPGIRLKQILALSECGIINFLGKKTTFDFDDQSHMFKASSMSLTQPIFAKNLIEARIAEPNVITTKDSLIQNLLANSEIVEDKLNDELGEVHTGKIKVNVTTGALELADGSYSKSRFAAGPIVKGGLFSSGFARPCTNAYSLRFNDQLARSMLLATKNLL